MPRHIIEGEVIPYVIYGGDWDPTSATFPTTADSGDLYRVSVSGVHATISFYAGDYIISVSDTPDAGTFVGKWEHISRSNPDEMSYKGAWDAGVGTFPGGGSAEAGHMYAISVGGTVDGQAFLVGDVVLATVDNASAATYAANWQRLPASGSTSTVMLSDADGDTKIQVEESADEDIIRFDIAGVETMTLDATNGLTMLDDIKFNTSSLGPVLKSASFTWRIKVDDSGVLTTELV